MFYDRAKQTFSRVLANYHEYLEVARGEGAYLYSPDGTPYLDLSSGIAVTSTGHCHPDVVAAVTKQVSTLMHHCIGIGCSEVPIAFSEKLCSLFGEKGNYKSFLAQSGTEAVEAAIKLAKYTSKRDKLLAFKGGFHGRTMGSLSITSKQKYRDGYGSLIENVIFLDYPMTYRCPWNTETESDCIQKSLESLESEYFSEDVAAVIVEPILGEGGIYMAPPEFLLRLEKKCREYGILLILDEIQTGMGRTGKWFAFQEHGLDPDIITVAKGIASGLPLSACVGKKDLMDAWDPGMHGGTYGGNPVACSAGLATIGVLESYYEQCDVVMKRLYESILKELLNLPCVGDIRYKGFMLGIELVKNKTSKEPAPDLVQEVLSRCLAKQIIVISAGIFSNVVRVLPALTIEEATLAHGLRNLAEVIRSVSDDYC